MTTNLAPCRDPCPRALRPVRRALPPPRPAPVAPIHKLNPTKNRAPPPIPSTLQPQAGEYTKERLLELQKNARSLGSSSKPPPPPPSQQQKPEPVVVLRGLIKPDATVEKSEDVETTEAKKEERAGDPGPGHHQRHPRQARAPPAVARPRAGLHLARQRRGPRHAAWRGVKRRGGPRLPGEDRAVHRGAYQQGRV
ncbi:transcriptional repressor ILP1-like [Iris pallida]|uniref:Transcriptional repressor ILP1-like n=1 Tax=Iris pallida TaxID=29817 RepID=A0AAX6F1S2_IRIPA|nr:transcriptional repressor ILP1-like [Iris pallida]